MKSDKQKQSKKPYIKPKLTIESPLWEITAGGKPYGNQDDRVPGNTRSVR